jgi:hypothetical protein
VYDAERGYDLLTKITRVSKTQYRAVPLAEVQFVPLLGKEGHKEDPAMAKLLRLILRSNKVVDEDEERSEFV